MGPKKDSSTAVVVGRKNKCSTLKHKEGTVAKNAFRGKAAFSQFTPNAWRVLFGPCLGLRLNLTCKNVTQTKTLLCSAKEVPSSFPPSFLPHWWRARRSPSLEQKRRRDFLIRTSLPLPTKCRLCPWEDPLLPSHAWPGPPPEATVSLRRRRAGTLIEITGRKGTLPQKQKANYQKGGKDKMAPAYQPQLVRSGKFLVGTLTNFTRRYYPEL